MVWTEAKDAGKVSFSQGDFHAALSSYQSALEQLTSEERRDGCDRSNDKQILLSNVVACRLKIGGEEMATQAIEDAKQCVALNNKWPKAHVRLASAYIALGGRSNDACQSLQRAISLDRTNKVARDMLIKEMRGRERNERNNVPISGSSDGGNPSSPQEETSHQSRPEQQSSSYSSSNGNSSDGIDVDDIDPPRSDGSISERLQYYFTKSVTWYQNQSDDMQTILKVSFALLLLYIALGGRFGLEYVFQKQRRGNYGHGNAYERYNSASRSRDKYGYASESSSNTHSQGDNSHRSTESSGYNDRTNPQNNQYYSRYSQHDDEYYEPRQRRGGRSSTTFHMPNLFDGSLISMIILFIIGTICHRFGVNPFQVFWILQAMQRGGRRHHYGYGGFGGGFGRRRMGRRGRW